MNKAVNANLAHESESQRQYARVKLPARLLVKTSDGFKGFSIVDVSAGGFAFESSNSFNKENLQGKTGRLEFNVDGFTFVMPVSFDIRHQQGNRYGCEFQGLNSRETASLRHLITSFLAGEVVTSGDMLNILSRDNFAKVRTNKSAQGLDGLAKAKALLGSALFFVVGLAAFGYLGSKLFSVLFYSESTSAIVIQDTFSVQSPREGVVELLVKEGDKVEAGAIVGTFSSPVLSFLGNVIPADQLNSDAVKDVVSDNFVGSLVSPCDCVVTSISVAPGEYVVKNKTVLNLSLDSGKPYVLASFDGEAAKNLYVSKPVTLIYGGLRTAGVIEGFESASQAAVAGNTFVARISFDTTKTEIKPGYPLVVTYSKFDAYSPL